MTASSSPTHAACWQTCLLALLSSVLLEIAAADGQPRVGSIVLSIGAQSLLLAASHLGCRRWIEKRRAQGRAEVAPTEILVPVIIGAALLPFGVEAISRAVFQTGSAFEVVLLAFMRNLVLTIAAASVWPTYQKTATGISVLLAIFASSVGNDRAMIALLGLYAVVGMWWLMGTYWGGLSQHLQATHERGLPRRWLVLVPLVVLLVSVALASQAPRTTAVVLMGIAPTSGGTQWHDAFARGGIGDGEALVSGTQDASTFGPVESDLFLESQETSLYDAFSDTYGEPVTKPKNGRAVPLPASLVKETEQRMAQAKQAHREFSTVRQTTPQRRDLNDIQSPAVIAVAGRGPLHLRLQTYDLFDGEDWYPAEAVGWDSIPTRLQTDTAAENESRAEDSSEESNRTDWKSMLPNEGGSGWNPNLQLPLKLVQREGKPWLALDDWTPANDVYDSGEHHVLKLLKLKTDRLPLPTNVVAFHIDRVDRPDMFGWAQESIVRLLSDEGVPPLTVLHSFSRVVDEAKIRKLRDNEIMPHSNRSAPLPIDAGTVEMGRVAQAWAGHLPRDWSRVEAVVAKLRSEFVHDRAVGCDSVATNPPGAVDWDPISTDQSPAASGSRWNRNRKSPPTDDERQAGSLSHVDNRVARFVLSERRGPDYLFASAACLMLRQLGFTTRLASGFYVDPQKYDAKRRHIPVTKDDVHFWCEVFLGARTWVPVEPTPGYELLAPPLSLWARCCLALKSLAAWSLDHVAILTAALLSLTALCWWRCAILDAFIRASWRWRAMTPRERVLAAHRLLEKRAVWAGAPKPEWMSARRWYATSLPHGEASSSRVSPRLDALRGDASSENAVREDASDRHAIGAAIRKASRHGEEGSLGEAALRDGIANSDCDVLQHWARFVDWAYFAPESVPVPDDIGPLCRLVLKRWSMGRLMDRRRQAS